MADEKLKSLLDTGAEVLSAGASAALGLAVVGATGTVALGALTPLAEVALKKLLADFATRPISRRQRWRAGTAAAHAVNQIFERLTAGESPRQDGFFQDLGDDRSPAETVLEGVLMRCRDQSEERKVPWIANIYANAVFSDIPDEVINRVIVLADRMMWRQFRILALVGRHEELGINARWITNPPAQMSRSQTVLLGEAHDLLGGQFGLLKAGPLGLNVLGRAAFDLMSLGRFASTDLVALTSAFPSGYYTQHASHESRAYDAVSPTV